MTKSADIEYASWSEWEPKDYLSEYYNEVMPDERFAMEFLVESLCKMPSVPVALDFGAGPTVHHIFPLAPKVAEIHLAEYLPANRAEIEKWLARYDDAHDWHAFALETLRLEGYSAPTSADVAAREQKTRTRITRILPADAGNTDPLGIACREFYPLVTT